MRFYMHFYFTFEYSIPIVTLVFFFFFIILRLLSMKLTISSNFLHLFCDSSKSLARLPQWREEILSLFKGFSGFCYIMFNYNNKISRLKETLSWQELVGRNLLQWTIYLLDFRFCGGSAIEKLRGVPYSWFI